MRALPSHFANTCTFGRRLAKSYCYYLSSYHILGGRAYPVRHYPIAVRLRTLAFGNMVAMIVAPVNIRATCASALPTHSRSSYLPSVERLFRGDPIIYIAPFYVSRYFLRVRDSSGTTLGVRSVALLHLAVFAAIGEEYVVTRFCHFNSRISI